MATAPQTRKRRGSLEVGVTSGGIVVGIVASSHLLPDRRALPRPYCSFDHRFWGVHLTGFAVLPADSCRCYIRAVVTTTKEASDGDHRERRRTRGARGPVGGA